MIITRIEDTNSYQIKLLGNTINVYDRNALEEIIKKIITKISKKNRLKKLINLEFYLDRKYGTIIILKDYNKLTPINNEIEIKITIHTDIPFLYKMEYFDIENINLNNKNIYYYQDSFYLEIKNNISKKEYLNILENSEIIYEETYRVINKGIKI